MTDIKFRKVVAMTQHQDALQAYETLQHHTCQEKLTDALDLAHACILATQQIRPDLIDELVRYTDTYVRVLRTAVQARGGTGLEIIATFPEGKVTIDKFSR